MLNTSTNVDEPIISGRLHIFLLVFLGVIFLGIAEVSHLMDRLPFFQTDIHRPMLTFVNTLSNILTTLGSILIGTALIEGAFHVRFHRQIENQVTQLSNNISTLQNTVMIAKGAVDAGLMAVYATREECLKEIKNKMETALHNVKNGMKKDKKIKISILGISLGDFLCPHGLLQPTFRELLKSDCFEIRVAILDEKCGAAISRAIHEELGKFKAVARNTDNYAAIETNAEIYAVYENTKCHDELKTATDYLKDLVSRQQIDRDEPAQDNHMVASLEAYAYTEHPMAFIFVMDDDMFIESYHLAGRGGEAPILQVSKYKKQTHQSEESKLYKIYMGHFESILKRSRKIKHDLAGADCVVDNLAQKC